MSHCVDLGDVGLPISLHRGALRAEVGPRGRRRDHQHPSRARQAARRRPSSLDGNGEDQAGRLQLFESITAAVTAPGRPDAPLVLIIEDLHWADPSTRDVLRFLLARMRAEHLLVIASYRADDLHRRHPCGPSSPSSGVTRASSTSTWTLYARRAQAVHHGGRWTDPAQARLRTRHAALRGQRVLRGGARRGRTSGRRTALVAR
ncbi:ATP-binding protein [Oerskovia sp. M15]